MPSAFTQAQVEAIAALAHLELDPAETELFGRQLGEILGYAAEVQQVDTTGVPPTAYVTARAGAGRADEVRPSLPRQDVFANAPDAAPDAGLFRVPRVIG